MEVGLKTCLAVSYIVDGEFKGVVEFLLTEEWYEVPEIVEKVKFYL